MVINNQHLTIDEYMKFMDNFDVADKTTERYKELYGRIIDKWNRPSDWIENIDKRIVYGGIVSNTYWYNWSLCKNEKLPLAFIKNERVSKSQAILKAYIINYDELEKATLDLKNKYSCSYSIRIFSTVLTICLFLGINNIERISFNDLSKAFTEGLLDVHELYFMDILMQSLGCYDVETIKDEAWKKIIRGQKNNNKEPCWSFQMETIIDGFLNDMGKNVCSKTRNAKEAHLKLFGVWLFKDVGNVLIEDLKCVDSNKWLMYVSFTIKITELSERSRDARLTTVMQFFDWLKTKRRDIISDKLMYSRADFKILNSDNDNDNLAFDKREHGEKILDYLINSYKPINSVVQKNIKDEFCKELVIISANSGMRISEIINMEYKSVFFSDDEKNYKMIINYMDKLGQVNRPVYFTKDGYDAVKRLEKLRRKSGKLTKRYNNRTKTSFIHLFEFEGKNPIRKNYIYGFLMRVKYILNLVDDNGRCVKGNVHAYRHFFGMTVFRLSDYNISVVRYLLGHRSYTMSEKYLVEEDKLLFSNIREERDIKKIAGKGVDTFYDLVYNSIIEQGKYNKLEKYLGSNEYLSDIIIAKGIKKITLGYCLNPCGKENKCFKCNNFLVTEKEKNDLFSFLKDLIGIIGCKVEKANISVEEAIRIPSVSTDIDDIIILIEELKNLGVSDNELIDKLNDKNGVAL